MTLSDNIEDFCFLDTETRSLDGVKPPLASVVTAGTYAYADVATVIILTYAIGNGPVQIVAMDEGFDMDGFRWRDMPDDLRRFHDRVEAGKAWYAAQNMGFDRTVWYRSTLDFPKMEPHHCIDVMAQATASNLPGSLEGQARALKIAGKQDDGKALINLFCSSGGATPQSHPEEWARFKSYGVRDTALLREVYRSTRPLPRSEWEEYWASERINERGMAIDVEFAARCAAIADANIARSNAKLKRITGGVITAVTQRERIANWVYDRITHSEAREMMVKEFDEGESEEGYKVTKIGISRDRIEAMLAFYAALEEKQDGLSETDLAICEVLEIRQWDGSSSPQKFQKMLDQQDEGSLRGSYVFNGANQTGRFSSKGVQVHNLPNKFLGLETKEKGLEVEAIEMINALEEF